MSTCRKIVNWKKTLVFPEEANLSPESLDLIRRLVQDSSRRLPFDEIKAHPFFRGLDWNNVRNARAAIVPKVTSEVDTRNFDKFDALPNHSVDEDSSKQSEADKSFIGYTFKRNDDVRTNVNDLFSQLGPTEEESGEQAEDER